MNTNKPKDIDEYIDGFPADVRIILEEIRTTIKKAAPDAEETVKYNIPTFTLNGNLIHFAAFQNHIGMYPAPTRVEAFEKELSVYKQGKDTVQFPLDKPMPFELISRIIKFQAERNLEKAVKRKK